MSVKRYRVSVLAHVMAPSANAAIRRVEHALRGAEPTGYAIAASEVMTESFHEPDVAYVERGLKEGQ